MITDADIDAMLASEPALHMTPLWASVFNDHGVTAADHARRLLDLFVESWEWRSYRPVPVKYTLECMRVAVLLEVFQHAVRAAGNTAGDDDLRRYPNHDGTTHQQYQEQRQALLHRLRELGYFPPARSDFVYRALGYLPDL
jgi:hypothetical protein